MFTLSKIKIQPKLLLSVYIVLPLAFLLFALDILFFNQDIKRSLAPDPNDYALFTAIFTLPHIFASFFGFIDKEYIKHYGKKILRGSQYAVVAIIGLSTINTNLMLFIFALYTMTHVFLQQSGISKSLLRPTKSKYYTIWQWSGVAISSSLYAFIYTNAFTVNSFHIFIFGLMLISFLISAFYILQHAKQSVGTAYFISTTCLPITVAIFVLFDYSILALAVPRIVHDITAYIFYASHDHNRYIDMPTNYIYAAAVYVSKLPVIILSPVLSIFIVYLIQSYSQLGSLVAVLIFISVMHYYIESFMWKKGSIHRRYIDFKL